MTAKRKSSARTGASSKAADAIATLAAAISALGEGEWGVMGWECEKWRGGRVCEEEGRERGVRRGWIDGSEMRSG